MELPNLRQYGASLYQFVVGPVLRAGILVGLIIYVLGTETVGDWFAAYLPSLRELTSPDVRAFMKLYGLSTLMPLVVLVLAIAGVHAIEVLIVTVARYLPPHFAFRHSRLAVAALGEPLVGLVARRVGVTDPEQLDRRVMEALADLRRQQPDDERLLWPDGEKRRASGAQLANEACKTYLLLALILLLDGVRRGEAPQVSRALLATSACAVALILTAVVALHRYKAALEARYQAALSIVPVGPSEDAAQPLPWPAGGGQWWELRELTWLHSRLTKRGARRHRRRAVRPPSLPDSSR